MPQRVKEIIVFNAPSYMDTGVNIVKMFVKQKIKERVSTWIFTHQGFLIKFSGQRRKLDNFKKKIEK